MTGRCPGLPTHGPEVCNEPCVPGDRYCAACRAEFDATPYDAWLAGQGIAPDDGDPVDGGW